MECLRFWGLVHGLDWCALLVARFCSCLVIHAVWCLFCCVFSSLIVLCTFVVVFGGLLGCWMFMFVYMLIGGCVGVGLGCCWFSLCGFGCVVVTWCFWCVIRWVVKVC